MNISVDLDQSRVEASRDSMRHMVPVVFAMITKMVKPSPVRRAHFLLECHQNVECRSPRREIEQPNTEQQDVTHQNAVQALP